MSQPQPTPKEPIAIGSDEAGYPLRARVERHLCDLGYRVDDYGSASAEDKIDYPDVAVEVAQRVARGDYGRAILVCGTGIGMAIAPNFRRGRGAGAGRCRPRPDSQALTRAGP